MNGFCPRVDQLGIPLNILGTYGSGKATTPFNIDSNTSVTIVKNLAVPSWATKVGKEFEDQINKPTI